MEIEDGEEMCHLSICSNIRCLQRKRFYVRIDCVRPLSVDTVSEHAQIFFTVQSVWIFTSILICLE